MDGIDNVILMLAAMGEAAPPERTTCPNCGTHVHPVEKTVGGITYFNCRHCDFSTWDWTEWIGRPAVTKLEKAAEEQLARQEEER